MAGDATERSDELSPDEAELLRDAAKAERYQTMRQRGRQIGGEMALSRHQRRILDPSDRPAHPGHSGALGRGAHEAR